MSTKARTGAVQGPSPVIDLIFQINFRSCDVNSNNNHN